MKILLIIFTFGWVVFTTEDINKFQNYINNNCYNIVSHSFLTSKGKNSESTAYTAICWRH